MDDQTKKLFNECISLLSQESDEPVRALIASASTTQLEKLVQPKKRGILGELYKWYFKHKWRDTLKEIKDKNDRREHLNKMIEEELKSRQTA